MGGPGLLPLLAHTEHAPAELGVGGLVALVVLLALVLVLAAYVQAGAEDDVSYVSDRGVVASVAAGAGWLPGAVRSGPPPEVSARTRVLPSWVPLCVAAAGLVHAAAAVTHLSATLLHAAAFAALAVAQVALARQLQRRADASALRLTLAVSSWVSLLWVLTRTTGVALVSAPAAAGPLDVVATALQLVAAHACWRALGRGGVGGRP